MSNQVVLKVRWTYGKWLDRRDLVGCLGNIRIAQGLITVFSNGSIRLPQGALVRDASEPKQKWLATQEVIIFLSPGEAKEILFPGEILLLIEHKHEAKV